MQPALDRNTLDRLISLGRDQGHLTTQDLRSELPIESMSAEEIALIVTHLEEGGIPVELEDSLIDPEAKPRPLQARSAEIIPFPGRSAAARRKPRAAPLQGATMALPPSDHLKTKPQESRRAHWAVAGAGLLVLLVLALLIHFFGI